MENNSPSILRSLLLSLIFLLKCSYSMVKLFPNKKISTSKVFGNVNINLYNVIDFSEADMDSVTLSSSQGDIDWEFENQPYEWFYGRDNEFALLMSSDL